MKGGLGFDSGGRVGARKKNKPDRAGRASGRSFCRTSEKPTAVVQSVFDPKQTFAGLWNKVRCASHLNHARTRALVPIATVRHP